MNREETKKMFIYKSEWVFQIEAGEVVSKDPSHIALNAVVTKEELMAIDELLIQMRNVSRETT